MLMLTGIAVGIGLAVFIAAKFGDRIYDRAESVVNIFKEEKENENDGKET